MLKTQISAKATKFQFPKKSKNYCKIKPFFGLKLGLNCPPGAVPKVIRNSKVGYNKTIHLYFLGAKFQLLRICRSRLNLEETTTFLWFRIQISQNQCPIFFQFSMKTIITFFCICAFSGTNDPRVKDQEVTG